jgi:hypothetical protein
MSGVGLARGIRFYWRVHNGFADQSSRRTSRTDRCYHAAEPWSAELTGWLRLAGRRRTLLIPAGSGTWCLARLTRCRVLFFLLTGWQHGAPLGAAEDDRNAHACGEADQCLPEGNHQGGLEVE